MTHTARGARGRARPLARGPRRARERPRRARVACVCFRHPPRSASEVSESAQRRLSHVPAKIIVQRLALTNTPTDTHVHCSLRHRNSVSSTTLDGRRRCRWRHSAAPGGRAPASRRPPTTCAGRVRTRRLAAAAARQRPPRASQSEAVSVERKAGKKVVAAVAEDAGGVGDHVDGAHLLHRATRAAMGEQWLVVPSASRQQEAVARGWCGDPGTAATARRRKTA